MIRLENLSLAFGATPILRGVSLHVPPGESFALVGESGSGKSTVLRVLSGQLTHWTGRVELAGYDLAHRRDPALIRRVQMVFQDPYGSLHPRHSIDDTLSEPLVIHRIPDRDTRVLAALDAVGLPRRFRYRLPHQLSGGQRQRVAIARALMLEPEVMLLDEPTSALDVSVQAEVLNLLKDLRESRGLTYLLVTHDLPVAAFLCDRIGVLHHGDLTEVTGIDALREGRLTSGAGQELMRHSLA